MPAFNAFSRNVNTVNLKFFIAHSEINLFDRKFRKHSGDRQSPKKFIKI